MSAKLATYISLVFFVVIGIMSLKSANNFSGNSSHGTFGPGYFPVLLSIILIILCLISFVKTAFEKNDEKLVIPHFKRIVLTILLTIIFVLSIMNFQLFYIQTFIFLSLLLTLYRMPLVKKTREISVNVAISLGFSLILYIVFDVMVSVNF